MSAAITLSGRGRPSRSSNLTVFEELRRNLLRWLVFAMFSAGLCQASLGQDYDIEVPGETPSAPQINAGSTLFENVRIFDGKSATLSTASNVLVRGNIIERISASPITVDSDVNVIKADGRVLMPGLIDAHWHVFMAATPQSVLLTADPAYLQFLAARQAEATLMRGFTTVRDMGGPVFGLKRAIDEGVMTGPRIYPSGAMISQTSGHGDFRFRFEIPRSLGGPLSNSESEGIAAIADSPDEVRLRAREQLRWGASQIKLMGGGGVSSPYNPIEFNAVHRGGTSRRCRGGRQLGHLCRLARIHPACDPAGDRRWRQMHRAWSPDRRTHRQAAC